MGITSHQTSFFKILYSRNPRLSCHRRASALLIVLLLAIVFMGIGTSLTISSIHKKRTSEKYQDNILAYLDANSGQDKAIYELSLDLTNSGSWVDGDINGVAWGPSTGSYSQINTGAASNGGTYTTYLQNVAGSDTSIWVKTVVVRNSVTRTIEALLDATQAPSIWNYALLGGSGSAGTVLNGNFNVAGSVVVLGTSLLSTDYAMNLGAAATQMINNYNTLVASVVEYMILGDAPTTVFNGETVSSLGAKLHVKQGVVGLNGSAEIGHTNVAGNGWKETVDGVYTNHGFGGTMGVANVHSDNGTSNTWDLGNTLEFPDITAPYQGYPNYKAYLVLEKNMYVTTPAEDAILSNIDPTSSFAIGDANGSISMDGAGNMTINGYIYVGASGTQIVFRSAGAAKTIQYTGKGVIFCNSTGRIFVDALIPKTPGAPGEDFPENNLLAMVAPQDIIIDSPGMVAGAFFARGTTTFFQQTHLLGSVVSNYFNFVQAPTFYQVFDFQPYLPDGLIDLQPSGTSGLAITVWRES